MTVSFDREKFKKKFKEKHNKNSEDYYDDNSEVKDLNHIVKTYNKEETKKNENHQQKQPNKNFNRPQKKPMDDGTYKYRPFEAFFKSKKSDTETK